MKNLKDTLKKFDEKFQLEEIEEYNGNIYLRIVEDDGNSNYETIKKGTYLIKEFLALSIKDALEGVLVEKENNANVSEYYSGYNACRAKIKSKITNYLEELI